MTDPDNALTDNEWVVIYVVVAATLMLVLLSVALDAMR
jgi:hypothetical protein